MLNQDQPKRLPVMMLILATCLAIAGAIGASLVIKTARIAATTSLQVAQGGAGHFCGRC